MMNLKTICAVSMISAASFMLAGCPEDGADNDRSGDEAKPGDKKEEKKDAKSTEDKAKPADAKDGDKKTEKKDGDEKKDATKAAKDDKKEEKK